MSEFQYTCRRLTADGKLSLPLDPVQWESAQEVELREVVTGDKPRLATVVRAAWNDWGVYYRFVCEDDEIVSNMTQRDDPIYDEDVVEVFMSVDGDLSRYFEFEFSPTNVQFDAKIVNNLQDPKGSQLTVDTSWDSAELTSWVEVDLGNRRTVFEIAIPAADLLDGKSIQAGDTWRTNLYRIDRKPEGQDEYTAWSPTGIVRFHIPWRFGTFVFE
ncbi:carbohydrate-binding family 9-like protein [Paenibacillus koleovorans]|uniref:carbohydrate-binding family 9-like protein n=1 Tax=Paenibacillus koleovorans TaxID=121608 RepID=UPI000FDAAE5C|nr:carbohydrate-binding family 9-like protein [Paenibacillus koleovorans]